MKLKYDLYMPVHVTITETPGNMEFPSRLNVSIDGELYDDIEPPLDTHDEIVELIETHGSRWTTYAPSEWSNDDEDEE